MVDTRPADSALVQRSDRWRAVDGSLTRMAETATPKIRAVFRAEGSRVLEAIDGGATAEEAGELVDVEEWKRVLFAIWLGFGKILFSQTLAELRPLKQEDPELEEFPFLLASITGFVALRAESLTANTKRRLLAIESKLAEGVAAVAAQALRAEVKVLYTKWEAGRAASIARHNVMAATAIAQHFAAVHSGVLLSHEWVAMQDGKVREDHANADGQIKRLEEPFFVGGEILEEPRDPAGSPGNTANCRCQEIYSPA